MRIGLLLSGSGHIGLQAQGLFLRMTCRSLDEAPPAAVGRVRSLKNSESHSARLPGGRPVGRSQLKEPTTSSAELLSYIRSRHPSAQEHMPVAGSSLALTAEESRYC
jgi:hypothetical protein